MSRTPIFLLAIATLSTPVFAQNAYINASSAPLAGDSFTQSPAPIERPADIPSKPKITESEPAPGLAVRADHTVQTITADTHKVELRLDHGRANIMVNNPAEGSLTLVDLPGGQVQLLKNGLYTFNADTNTVRVLRGEADAFLQSSANPLKVKEDQQIVLVPNAHPSDFDRYYARQDFLPGNPPPGPYADRGSDVPPPPAYGFYGPYGDGYYPYAYPYYAWGYPYWGWGYPVVGFGFYGGHFGGFRGGYGFHGGGFRR